MIPTLNEAQRLPRLLESLRSQVSAPDFEVLVSDGNSSDGTTSIVKSFEGVRLIEATRGVSRQRNAGAQAALGELLVFLDADDLPPPRFLAQVWASFRRLPFAVACPWFVAHDGGVFTRLCYLGFNLGFFLGQSTLRMGSGVCLICPRQKFLDCGGFDESMHLGEDVRLIRQLCPRFGLHRHLLVPLHTSGRRFEHEGVWKLMWFYSRITPLLIFGLWKPLQKFGYRAAPYKNEESR